MWMELVLNNWSVWNRGGLKVGIFCLSQIRILICNQLCPCKPLFKSLLQPLSSKKVFWKWFKKGQKKLWFWMSFSICFCPWSGRRRKGRRRKRICWWVETWDFTVGNFKGQRSFLPLNSFHSWIETNGLRGRSRLIWIKFGIWVFHEQKGRLSRVFLFWPWLCWSRTCWPWLCWPWSNCCSSKVLVQ